MFQGLSKGLISQIINLAAFVFALTIAVSVGPTVADAINRVFAFPVAYRQLIGFFVAFLAIEFVLRLVLRYLGHLIPGLVTASLTNRILGIIPSLAEMTLVVTLVFAAINAVPSWSTTQQAVRASRLAPIFTTFGTETESVVNRILGEQLRQVTPPGPIQ